MAFTDINVDAYRASWEQRFIQTRVWEPLLADESARLATASGDEILIPVYLTEPVMHTYAPHTALSTAQVPNAKFIKLSIADPKYSRFEEDITEQYFTNVSSMAEQGRLDAESFVKEFEKDLRTAWDVDKTDVGNVPDNRKIGPDTSGVISVTVANVGMADHVAKYWAVLRSARLLARQLNWPDIGLYCVVSPTIIDWLIAHQETLKLPSINDARIATGLNNAEIQPLRGWRIFVDNGINQTVDAGIGKHSMYFGLLGQGMAYARRFGVNRFVDVPNKFAQELQHIEAYGFSRLNNNKLFRVHTPPLLLKHNGRYSRGRNRPRCSSRSKRRIQHRRRGQSPPRTVWVLQSNGSTCRAPSNNLSVRAGANPLRFDCILAGSASQWPEL